MKFADVYKNYNDGQEIFRRPSVTLILEELKDTRQQLRDLTDTNTALIIYNRRIRLVIGICMKVFDTLDTDGALFIPPSVKAAIKQAREQVSKLDHSLASSQEICEKIQ